MARPGIEPRTSDLRVRCPTDCATGPGLKRRSLHFCASLYDKDTKATIKILKIGTLKIITIILLKMGQFGFKVHPKDTDGMPNSVDPNQTAP